MDYIIRVSKNQNHQLCPIPFSQLYLHSSGEVYTCSFTQDYSLGNVKHNTLLEIWNGPKMLEFRKQHLEFANKRCQKSQSLYACHLHHDHLSESLVPQVKMDSPPKRIDFMIDSFCNIKCIMCTNVLEDNGGFDHEDFWSHCQKHIFPFTKEIEIIGGEPFIIENTFKLVEMVSRVNPDCLWRVTTNANYKFNDRFKALADKMKFESFAVSIDSLKSDVFAKIRDGAKLDLVIETLDRWIDYSKSRPGEKKMKIVCNFVIQKDNAYELASFIDFCEKKKIVPYPILLRDPVPFTIFDLPIEELEKIYDFYIKQQEQKPHPSLALVIHKIFKELPASSKMPRIEKYSKIIGKQD